MAAFEHSQLEPDTIRLIRFQPDSTPSDIRITLEHQSQYFNEEVSYATLSYCWRDPTPVATIQINDRPFAVAQNLFDWFQTQRYHPDRLRFWVDAICINQSDISERNEQVKQMGRIYACAEFAVSWLGPSDEGLAKAFEVLKEIEDLHMYDDDGIITMKDDGVDRSQDFKDAYSCFHELDYWSRVWIVPEILNAAQIIIHAGSSSSNWANLDGLASLSNSDFVVNKGPSWLLGFRRLSAYAQDRIVSFEQTLGLVAQRNCSDPRDKLFALAGIASMLETGTSNSVRPDYRMSIDEVRVMALAHYDHLRQTIPLSRDEEWGAELDKRLLGNVLQWTPNGDPYKFKAWLLQRINDKCVRGCHIKLNSGETLDCSGPILQDLLADAILITQGEGWKALYIAHRDRVLRALGERAMPADGQDRLQEIEQDVQDPEDPQRICARCCFTRVSGLISAE